MFKNKSIQVNLVDTNKKNNSAETTEATVHVDYVQIARETTETVAKHLIIGVATYVAVDTLRQVIVKLTPTH